MPGAFLNIIRQQEEDALALVPTELSIPFFLSTDKTFLLSLQNGDTLNIDQNIQGEKHNTKIVVGDRLRSIAMGSWTIPLRQFQSIVQDMSPISSGAVEVIPIKSREKNNEDKAGGSGKVGFEYSWGGKDGGEFRGYVEGEVHDESGNYVEGRAEQNSKGEGSVGVYGGHKDEKK
ncbi:MAG TPA: hypothetical protein VFF29_05905 [Bacteroidota bacterium]|nr:hypothetical protein [Bacteroidota bacterium]